MAKKEMKVEEPKKAATKADAKREAPVVAAKPAGKLLPSMAKRLKKEWHEAKNHGEKRSLRQYAAVSDVGQNWLHNKSVA